ncbi:MAG: mannose-1-phosphate guanylyltransferase/mannose-6-phosphate isomerase [Candidatus Margulisbacteria bacterium GWF2_35_9]|nr:MAG: mannose-1-phosphate guanylyltransferase/mannose-6-phosphate isomerase [Candidatus Margulisbacteria bacterium GWF2_35_9]
MKIVILAGGSGTRLWPLSRKSSPKQFIKIFNNRSLFQETIERNKPHQFMVVTNETQYFLVVDQAAESKIKNLSYILEPMGRNTAPAIALACLKFDPEDIVLVTPSDHFIENVDNYRQMMKEAETLASDGYLVTFGIKPSFPSTGYGYIESDGTNVLSFKEKPELALAKKYLEKKSFFWNSGMFMFKAGAYLNELKKNAPEIYSKSVKAIKKTITENNITRISEENMMDIPSDSIDYAVMEKCKTVKMVFADIGWSDLGSFDELSNVIPKDTDNNAVIGQHLPLDSKNNLIISKTDKLISTIGVEDLIIIETDDALLVTKKGHSQKVKQIVEKLAQINSPLTDIHTTVHRPWGTYQILLEMPEKYKIKKIVVSPKHKLSLQKHFHRNEHWIVVSGMAKITNGTESYYLKENESTYIPMGQIHRLENPGKIDLVMIEAQVGGYLGEDDIVRLDDDFKRI